MRVHIISNLFSPDELAGASLFTDLAMFLKERGHEVRVTGTFSYYPAWKLRQEDRGISWRQDYVEGIPVRRVRMYVPEHPTGKTRILSDMSFLAALLRRGSYRGWRPDVVVTALPMLAQCLAQRFLYWGRGVPRLIVVQDFVVDAALELKILRLPGLEPFLRGVERWALRSASTLLTISPLMLEKLRAGVGDDRRTCYVPNWIHWSLRQEIERQSAFPALRRPLSLFHAGNLGVKQGLPAFLAQFRMAKAFRWSLAIHGGGADRERLAEEVARTPGCSLGHVLEEESYVASLRCCAACLVTQSAGVGSNFLPSKLLPALATGTPVLAVCERHSPLAQEVTLGGYGEVVAPGDSVGLARVLSRWECEPALLESLRARAALRAPEFARERILSLYEMELLSLAPPQSQTAHEAFAHI